MGKAEESIDGMEKFNEKIYEDGITWLFGHHCLECGHLTFAQHEVKELSKYFYESGYHQAEKDNELSLEDVEIILNAFLDFRIEKDEQGKTKRYTDKEYCQEALKRLKDFKERKEK